MSSQAIIFFDGKCNLCNSAVQFILKRDKNGYFKFASLQSAFSQNRLGLNPESKKAPRSLALLEDGVIYWRSTAALRITKHLSGGWKLYSALLVIPKFLRDPAYNFIATHRYKWFGKRATCMRPTPAWQSRFIDD